MRAERPRLLIAGLSGDSGKTLVSLSLVTAYCRKGLRVAPFKKGPDYIDAAWLGWAADSVCRNLDSNMVDSQTLLRRFVSGSEVSDLALVEANRGLFDGQDSDGTHSSAALARLIAAPVVLVVDATKATRTLAALVKGCMAFESGTTIGAVILNRVAGPRHERVVRESIEKNCGIPVVGALPKLDSEAAIIPQRHLGLVPPAEMKECRELADRLAGIAERYIDLDALHTLASSAGVLTVENDTVAPVVNTGATIGYFSDSVFTFYYPENLEALGRAGVRLVAISSIDDNRLPDIDALYIGGGFPETQLEKLLGNTSLMKSVRDAGEAGMPIYAECGGLIYLSRTLHMGAKQYQLAGLLDVDLEMHPKPCGHGYVAMTVDRDNPYYTPGTTIRGHEFHYTGIMSAPSFDTCMQVARGSGLGLGRDGLVYRNCLASYMHIHADGVPEWAPAFVRAASRFREQKSRPQDNQPYDSGEESHKENPAIRAAG